MPLQTPPPPERRNRSHTVQELIARHLTEQEPPTWMSEELLNDLMGAFEASRTHALIHMVKAGMITHEQAQDGMTPPWIFVTAFALGLTIGENLEKDNQFRIMMGEEPV